MRAGSEEDVPVLQDDAEGDLVSIGKHRAVRPGVRIVLREENLPAAEAEGLVVALGVNEGPPGAMR